jgi:hypothetical protein
VIRVELFKGYHEKKGEKVGQEQGRNRVLREEYMVRYAT